MPRFAPKYSAEQLEAIYRYVLDDRQGSPRQAAKVASESGLYELEPWSMNPSTAAHYVTAERKRRRGEKVSETARKKPAEAQEINRQRILTLVDQELAYLEKRDPGNRDLDRLLRLSAVHGKLAQDPLVKPGQGKKGRPAKREEGSFPGADRRLIERIAKDAAEAAAQRGPPNQGQGSTENGDAEPAVSSPARQAEAERGGEGGIPASKVPIASSAPEDREHELAPST